MKYFLFLLLGILALGGSSQVPPKENKSSVSLQGYEGNREGLIALLKDIQKMNKKERIRMARQLRPKPEDYNKVFVNPDFADRVYQYHRKLYSSSAFVIQPNLPEHTDILIWKATQPELKSYTQDAVYFPGGYREIANQIQPDCVFYRMKYIKPGKNTGSNYESFIFVNGVWRFFPRPWSVVVGER